MIRRARARTQKEARGLATEINVSTGDWGLWNMAELWALRGGSPGTVESPLGGGPSEEQTHGRVLRSRNSPPYPPSLTEFKPLTEKDLPGGGGGGSENVRGWEETEEKLHFRSPLQTRWVQQSPLRRHHGSQKRVWTRAHRFWMTSFQRRTSAMERGEFWRLRLVRGNWRKSCASSQRCTLEKNKMALKNRGVSEP